MKLIDKLQTIWNKLTKKHKVDISKIDFEKQIAKAITKYGVVVTVNEGAAESIRTVNQEGLYLVYYTTYSSNGKLGTMTSEYKTAKELTEYDFEIIDVDDYNTWYENYKKTLAARVKAEEEKRRLAAPKIQKRNYNGE